MHVILTYLAILIETDGAWASVVKVIALFHCSIDVWILASLNYFQIEDQTLCVIKFSKIFSRLGLPPLVLGEIEFSSSPPLHDQEGNGFIFNEPALETAG